MPGYSKLPDDLLGALGSYRSLALGATCPVQSEFPPFFDSTLPRPVRPRDPLNYEYLGFTVTRPDVGSLVFGLSYKERERGTCKEDLFVVNLDRGDMWHYDRGGFEEIDARYRGTHHGDKMYLAP